MVLTRSSFLRLGAVSALTFPSAARAGLPRPAPVGDDAGFLQFGALAERTTQRFYTQAGTVKGAWTAAEHRQLRDAARAKAAHFSRLQAALGEDAPSAGDFAIDLPKSAFASKRSALRLGEGLEKLLVGVYLYGVGFTADPATRLLLGRLLASDARQLAWLQGRDGRSSAAAGLPDPLDVDAAGERLDHYLKATTYPTT